MTWSFRKESHRMRTRKPNGWRTSEMTHQNV